MHPPLLHKKQKAQNNRLTNFDRLAYGIGIVTSLFNLPQIYKIWSSRSAAGISLIAWIGFAAASVFWLVYSIIHKEKALILTFMLTLIFQLLIIIGAAIYR